VAAAASRALAYGRLLRLSLAPSALADIAAGCVLGAGLWPRGAAPFVLMLGSSCVYHGGMALNDWADRAEDARARPTRPIPSGALAPTTALGLAFALLVLGPCLALVAAPRCALVLGVVALCAALYDLAGRGPWRGPFLLGLCRAGNLGAGLALASTLAPWRSALWFAPCVYGTYVFLVSRLARLEDTEAAQAKGARPARWCTAAALALLALGVLAAHYAKHPLELAPGQVALPWSPAQVLAFVGALGLIFAADRIARQPWNPLEIQRTAGMALRRLLICSATLAFGAGTLDGALVAFAILLGYPLAFALRKVFPPT